MKCLHYRTFQLSKKPNSISKLLSNGSDVGFLESYHFFFSFFFLIVKIILSDYSSEEDNSHESLRSTKLFHYCSTQSNNTKVILSGQLVFVLITKGFKGFYCHCTGHSKIIFQPLWLYV